MRKKIKSQQFIEQKEFRVFNPEDVKQAVEIPVKPQIPINEIEKVESIEDKEKTSLAKKSKKKSKKTKTDEKHRKIKLKPEGYALIITEKPQAAAKIAAALSEGNDNKLSFSGVPYFELERKNKKITVACAVGHLFTLSQNKKGSEYPVFDISWYPNFEIKKKDFSKKYFLLIKKLVRGASEVIIATDFDVEGEVIGYNIMRFIAEQNDAKRMKFSSLTAQELQKSYDNVHPSIEWGQAIAGETRHFVDWLYGINLSRALMSSIKSAGKFKIMSIGRVQGPTLNLIVEKEKEIQNFKPMPYWQVFITINDGKNKIDLKYIKDITKKQELDRFKGLEGRNAIAFTKETKESVFPPAPFDLTTLQTESYYHHSINPSQALQTAQKLYLSGLISYPRTSSQKIPEAIEPRKIIERLKHYFKEVEHVTRTKPVEGKKSDPAHPAIIPTGIHQKLEGNDERIYNLIAKRFISCFCDNAELENKKVEVEIEGMKFSEKGMEIIKKGWMNVYPAKMNEKEIKDFNGEVVIEKARIEEKITQPPRRFSPASIISELEKRNLGTKATRANIIDTLYNRNYIQGKSIQATELGVMLIESLKKYSPVIVDEKLTREIEKDMENIRASKKDLEKKEAAIIKKTENTLKKISEDFKKNEKNIGEELIKANNAIFEKEKENNKLAIKCPSCEKGELLIKFSPRFRSYFVACSSYPDCKQTFPLPSKSLIKRSEKNCDYCTWPMLISIRKGKKPWIFCFNPKCPTRLKKAENENSEEKN